MTLAHPSRLPHRSRPSGLSAPETTPGPTPYAPTPCQPCLLPGPQLVLDRAPRRSQCGERAGQCVESRGHGSRSPHIRTAAWSGPGRPGRAAPPPASARPSLGLPPNTHGASGRAGGGAGGRCPGRSRHRARAPAASPPPEEPDASPGGPGPHGTDDGTAAVHTHHGWGRELGAFPETQQAAWQGHGGDGRAAEVTASAASTGRSSGGRLY